MKTLAAVLLLAAPVLAQDRPVLRTWPELARAADRFAKGDDEAMRDLVRAGRPALRVLAERRREFPRDRRDALARLMMEIRWATARSDDDRALLSRLLEIPASQVLAGTSGVTWSIQQPGAPKPSILLGRGSLGFVDPCVPTAVPAMDVPVGNAGPALPHYDPLWEAAGLDFDALGGVLVVAPPERLWAAPPMPDPDLAAAARDVEALSANLLEDRTRAEEALAAAGPGVIPLLEKEGARDLAAALRRRWLGAVWDGPLAGAELAGPPKPVSARLQDAPLRLALDGIARKGGVTLEADEIALAGRTTTIAMENVPLRGLLAAVTRPQGLDFAVVDGKIRIVAR